MARHRSPQGRRAHLGPPLFAMAAAGVGGAHRPSPLSQPALPALVASTPSRLVAAVVAGGALAAAGQQVLTDALPLATDGTTLLRVSVDELLGTAPAAPAPLAAEPLVALSPVVPEPAVVDAADLVKAADLHRVAAEDAARLAEAARAERATAEQARAEQARAVRGGAERAGADRAGAERAGGERASAERARAERTGAGRAGAGRVGAAPATRPAATAADGVQMIVGRITSGFGSRWGSAHQGLDIAAPIGTPIHVPLDGTVIDSGPASGFGQWVRVEHGDGTVTVYGHINRSLVRVGEKVTAGDTIAEVGNRGRSTGPHLHFEVITPGGTKINPRPWLDERGIGLT